uniref:N-terminal acetyltransferase B complex subunit MDM20 homolog n=1 Tax=Lygus hesperus TaxID=30085 RepID=A0A0K8SV27_LYGHE
MANRYAGCPYTERRVRPIYDLLDNGNNKKALQEAEKVLKKQPNLLCAKALKCLALLRLGRESESLELLEVIKNESPVDESTLQAVTVCYREVHQPQSICEVYEKASAKEPANEDILNNLFYAYVRVGDYAKQKLTAMSLYKIKPKNQYYFWAFISTLLQSVENVNDLIQLCTIPASRSNAVSSFTAGDKAKSSGIALVHRLMEKFVNDDKIESEQEVLTYILVLEMLEKHEEALNVLSGPLSSKLEPSTVMNKKLDLLVKLKQWDQVHSQLEDMLFEEQDCWHCYLIYLDSVFELAKDKTFDVKDGDNPYVKANKFLGSMVDSQKQAQFKKRGPYLARLEYYKALTDRQLPAAELLGEFVAILQEYYTEFGAKDSCVHDLRRYLHLVENDIIPFLAHTYKCIGLSQDAIPSNRTQLNLLVSNTALCMIIGIKSMFGLNEKHKFIVNEINRYIACFHLCADAVVTDPKSCDGLALIAAHSLFELWTDTEDSNYLFDAIVLCEYALSQSPCNSQLKILLLKFYHLLGGSEGAQIAYISFDLKHMQLDTLGYLHLFPLIPSASYVHATHVLNTSIKFFTNNSKESADHVTFAYKYEALTKIPEFIGIREKMINSTHYLLSTTEKMLCEMFSAPNYGSCVQMAKDMEISLNLERIKWNSLRDNRDFSVLWDIEAPDRRITEECIVQSHNHNLVLLRLRSLLLHCIVSCLDIGKSDPPSGRNVNEAPENDSTFSKTRSKMKEFVIQLEETMKPVKNSIPSPLSKRFIAGPPTSRLLLMLQVNYFDLILNELRFLYSLVPNEDSNREKCQYQLDAMILFVDEYLRYVRSIAGSSQIQLRNTVIQVCSLFVELVCFSCIIAGVCEVMMSKAKQNLVKKNKKKKENAHRIIDSPDEFEWRVSLINKFTCFLVEIIKNLESILKSEEKLWSDKNIKLCELIVSCNVDNKEERDKIIAVSGTVLENLYLSYIANITQMSTVLKVKLKYLSTLKL